VTNAEIARVLGQIATMLEMDGANPFRIRAYREGARVVEILAEPAAVLVRIEGRLQQIKGIGKDLEQRVRDLTTTGTTALYEELKLRYPVSLVELTELQGLGPKRVKALFEKLGIRGREDLAAAASAGKLRELAGFGETVEKNVLRALGAIAAAGPRRMLIHLAWTVALEMEQAIRRVEGVVRAELAGSFRRRRESVGDLDIVVSGGSAEAVMSAFTTHPTVAEVLARGDTRSSVKLGNGLQVDLRHVPVESFGAALLYFTGSKQHNIELRKIAIDKGMSLNEYGLTQGERVVAAREEQDIYQALGLAWIPPELREASGEIEQARLGTLPRLVEQADLAADLHMHTDRSDGRDTLATMVRAARDRGYAYCAVTDHSKALGMTRGFDGARVRQSVGEMDAVRRDVPGIQVLHGLEVDILADGTLDLEDDALELLDWVIVSLHSSLGQPKDVVTQRVLRALEHPAVCLLGHPSGRKIGAREPADLDFERVFDRAAQLGVAMEINAQPDRMDLSDVNARLAKRRGLSFTIDTDAHSTGQLDNIRYGLFMARRAGLASEDVLNTRPFGAFEAWRRSKKGRPSPPAPGAAPVAAAEPPPQKRGGKNAPKTAQAAKREEEAAPKAPATRKPAKRSSAGAKTPAVRGTAKRAPARGRGKRA
jgi:DNA polymerase (family 10)